MTTIEKSIDVQVPVQTAYNQWTQFESFPYFMEGVERVVQIDDAMTHWETAIGGVRREFDAQITEQHPDERIAWRSVDGAEHGGVVTFHRLDNDTTRVTLQMEYEPDTLTEKAGTALGVVDRRINGDLKRFKEFIEHEGKETGAWRGDIPRAAQSGEQRVSSGPTQTIQADAGQSVSGMPPFPGPTGGSGETAIIPPRNS